MPPAPASAGSTLGASPPADPHPALWVEWQRLRHLHAGPDAIAESPKGETIYQELEHLSHLIRSTVASTATGLAAQFEYLTSDLLEDGYGGNTTVEIVVPALDAFLAELDGLDEF